jgi:hypothetical protein
MARDDKKDLPHGVVPVAAMFVGGVAARNLAAQGETRPQKALELAARLRRSGASPDTIHAETSKLLADSPYAGVHYGRDGLPRFEISDERARIRPAGLDRSGRGFVGDVVQHPDLYRAHPETQLLEVQKANFTGGGFDGRTLHIGSNHVSKAMLAGRTVVKQSARGVALHEMQHAVQDAEGFAPGASPDDFETRFPGAKNAAVRDQLYITTAGEVEAENTRARRNMTAAQRRATPPSRTETVPVSEQHLGVDEGRTGMARQFGGDLPKGYSVERHTNSMGQTNYKIMKGRSQVGNAYVRDLGNTVQVGRIHIDEAHTRKGISTALYARIESDLGKPLVPDGTLSEDAYRFWKKHRPESVAGHKALKNGGAVEDPYGMFKSEYADPETGGVRAGEVRRVQRMVEKSPPAGRTTKAAKPRATKQATPKIADLGEKIGGARKDTAIKTGPRRQKAAAVDPRPAWQRRFEAHQEIDRVTLKPSGLWSLVDTETNSKYGGKTIRRGLPSEKAALDIIPLAAVSQKHRVSSAPSGQEGYAIWRDVTDRKRVQIGTEVFPTREAAMAHMVQNAIAIVETKTGFGEEILAPPKPEQVFRRGPAVRKGDVKGDQFIKTFGFRGVEFGNWNNQIERQRVMNHAYDAMHDMAEVAGLDPKAMSLDGKLGLAFGARGHGGEGAGRAHYERNYGAINLTKMKGAGSLAHEWMHALDHFLARKDDPALDVMTTNKAGNKVFPADERSVDYLSHRVGGWARTKSLAEDVRASMKTLMDTMYYKEEKYVDDAAKVQKFADYPKQRLAERLDSIRSDLARERTYGTRFTKPASAAQLAEFDALAAKILSGDAAALEVDSKMVPSKSVWNPVGVKSIRTNDTLDGISAIMKKVRGRAGFSSDHRGPLDELRATMASWKDRQAVVSDAAAQTVKVRKIPTDFSMNSKRLDSGRVSDYWQTRHEMAARGFSSFIEDKIGAVGRQSDFLSWGSDNELPHLKMFNAKPFPEGAERVAINAQFETLFSAMKRAGVLPGTPTSAAPVAPVETSGLRGTQNAANLAAIVENRQANAQPQPVPAAPNATPVKPKAARKAKAAKVEAPKPQAGQTTGQGVAQPTPPAAKLPDTKPASRTDARAAFMASAKTTKLPGGGFEVTAPDGSKMTLPNAGTEAAAKITAFAKLGSAVNKLGAVSMIAVPVAAAYVAYQGTKSQAMADGRDGTAEAVGQAAVAAGGAAAIGYGMMKAIGGTLSVAAKLAPRIAPALGPVGLGIGVVAMGHGAYKGYQRHGIKGAALGLVGADSVLDAPAAPAPASAAQPQPVQGRLNADQKTQFATANAAYAAMKSTTENAPQKAGWTDEARIAAYVERIKRQGGTPSNIPYGGEPRKQMSGPGGYGGDSDKSRKAGNARTQ